MNRIESHFAFTVGVEQPLALIEPTNPAACNCADWFRACRQAIHYISEKIADRLGGIPPYVAADQRLAELRNNADGSVYSVTDLLSLTPYQ